MANPYLKKLRKDREFKLLEQLAKLTPDLLELLKLLTEIESEDRMTPVKFKAAGILEKAGMINGREFKEEMGLAQSTSSELLTRMIEDGTVMKVMDKQDARKKVFLLTEEGEEIYYRLASLQIKRLKVILGYLDKKDKQELLKSLKSLSEIFKTLEA